MKKLGLLTIIAMFLTFTLSYGQGITGSAHDFQSEGWNTTGEICVTCHTPHNADVSVAASPLWNHENTTATFTLYASTSLDATMAQPDGSSKLCLSCHDGTVAMDSFGGATGTTMISGSADVSTDLTDDHPISFTYDATLATTDGELHDPSSTLSGLGANIDDDLLFADRMECASCHDVHNSGGFGNLLVKSNAASALCLTCHDK